MFGLSAADAVPLFVPNESAATNNGKKHLTRVIASLLLNAMLIQFDRDFRNLAVELEQISASFEDLELK